MLSQPRIVQINKDIYNSVYFPYLEDDTRTQIFFGGSSSGKSVFLAQRTVEDVLRGRNYIVVRNVSNSLRSSTFNEIRKVISDWNLESQFSINKTEMVITCQNKKQIYFKGLDDVQKMKSITPEKGVITDIWIEEATETKQDDVKELSKRLRGVTGFKKRITFSFNPIMKTHWIFKKYFSTFTDEDTIRREPGLLIRKTTYKDNRFLEEDDIKELEDESDPYYRNVYSLGNWGTLGKLVFDNWEIRDLSKEMNTFPPDQYRNGLDFGFTVHPTSFVRSVLIPEKREIHIHKGFYLYNRTNPELAEIVKPLINDERIWCDSEEPKSVRELRNYGINARGAIKGKGSVNFGIQWLKQYRIVIHEKEQDIINEFQIYQFGKDKDGEYINIPVKSHDHAVDGLRYSYSDKYMGEKKAGMTRLSKRTLGLH